jgi:hypothetical protein
MQRSLPGHISLCQQCRVHSSQHTATQNNVMHLHTRLYRQRRWALWENQWVKNAQIAYLLKG